jgi:eukaryotic-like serine/threonine-protein kinase
MTAVERESLRIVRLPTLDKYDVKEELGHGGMATVYRARDPRLGRDVAVKVIHPHLRDSAEVVRRFSIEAQAVAKLRHPNIVEVYDVSSPNETEQYLVAELLRGQTLRRILDQHGALPAEVAVAIALELLAALVHAHQQGVVHRDVKPENVIIEHRPAAESTGERHVAVKLTDFGIAKLLDAQGVTSTGQVLGSPAHMAPEQIEGRDVDGRADVFGIGVLLYECMVGHLPFQGTNPAQVLRRVLEGEYDNAEREKPTVGRAWSMVLDRALAANVEERFETAVAMRDALVLELTRTGFDAPRPELERWLDAPDAYTKAHDTAMPARLCSTGDLAFARKQSLVAAADYNRALAYAPHDANLLRLVSRLNRRTARRETLVRYGPVVVLSLAAVGAGLLVSVPVKRTLSELPTSGPSASVNKPGAPTQPSPSASEAPAASVDPGANARTLARPTVARASATPKPPAMREFRFASLEPPQGVRVQIDQGEPIPVDPAAPLVLDSRAHSLLFSCVSDYCDKAATSVEPGTAAAPLTVKLTIKPSRLVVHGDPQHHFFLNGDPAHPLRIGENEVPMTQSAVRVVRVTEVETERSESVELRAGKVAKPVDFTAP